MRVRDVLTSKAVTGVITVGAQETLSALATRLREKRVGAIVVVDQSDAMIGVISERDLVRALGEHGAAALTQPIANHMTRDVKTATPEDPAATVLERMTAGRFRHMPVVDDGRMIGLVSIGDVVKAHIDSLRADNEALEAFIRS